MEKTFPMSTTQNFKSTMKPRDANAQRVRKFCRIIEKNMNNYINIEGQQDSNRQCQGFFLKIDSINGIKRNWKDNIIPKDRNFYMRFFLTFFNQKTLQFFGNTYKSQLLPIR